jgi:hypothetical protein
MPQASSTDEILAREARTRRPAAYAALLSALFVIAAMVLEYTVAHADIPDFDASDLVQTLAAARDQTEFPRSFLTAVAQFQLDHSTENILIALLRGISVLLLLPMALVLIRATKDRGGRIGAWVMPAAVVGYVVLAICTFVIYGVLQLAIYRSARNAGFEPADVWDAVRDSPSNAVQIALFLASIAAGIATAITSVQAIRVGLLPKTLGYMGVLVGMLFIFSLSGSDVIRAFWFGGLAFVVSGRLVNYAMPAWDTGTAVAPEPRQPAAPREKKKNKS